MYIVNTPHLTYQFSSHPLSTKKRRVGCEWIRKQDTAGERNVLSNMNFGIVREAVIYVLAEFVR